MSCLLDEGELPSRGGQRPHLVLTMRLSDLVTGLGTATLDTGACLTAAEARRLACDAAIIPMVLGSDSMPLDVGRQHRLAIAALRDALAQRDKGCSFPSCNRPPRYTQAHPLRTGSTGAKQNSAICASCVNITTPSRTGKDGTSDSTRADSPNSSRQRPWTPPEHHSTTHSGSKTPSERRCEHAALSVEGHAEDGIIMSGTPLQNRAGGELPQRDLRRVVRDRQDAVVRAECDGVAATAVEGSAYLSAVHVPQPCCAVVTAGNEDAPIRIENYSQHDGRGWCAGIPRNRRPRCGPCDPSTVLRAGARPATSRYARSCRGDRSICAAAARRPAAGSPSANANRDAAT